MKTFIIAVLALVSSPVIAEVQHAVGVARSDDTKALRYIEHHQYLSDQTHIIRYFDASLNLIALKMLTYESLPQHPTIEQRDLLTKTNISIRPNGDEVTQTVDTATSTDSFSTPLDANTVIDAGFDAYIRSQWDDLVRDRKPAVFKFAIAGRDMTIRMRVKSLAPVHGDKRFVVEPKNWVLRQLVPQIRLTYDENKRLAEYQGFSNIAPAVDESRTVSITYTHYSLDRELDQPLTDWISAMANGEITIPRG
jgi:hypothetical protein